eukprot:gnl/TRDRNA2_/TRDRNA2_32883_c1_seq1.p1 gnl/TRDRNA2_/TRDRNA2_32883_c1~~gnl/TRDRNA2_/TRDRNA2_32883_c1_seq1.p1  ORF type:complete len:248 (-),score=25.84 gnl/TRDRNA2_/TRDRNA2_32883_c1_seq1:126-812(-)
MFAKHLSSNARTSRFGRASIISVPCGHASESVVCLRPRVSFGHAGSGRMAPSFGPAAIPVELTRGHKILRNLANMYGQADGGDLSIVPRVPEMLKTLTVDEVRYTHADVSSLFKDGRSIESLVDELCSSSIDPLQAKFLELDVVHWGSPGNMHYWTLRNRRLHCLKEYQRRLRLRSQGSSDQVKIRAYVLPLEHRAVYAKFAECYSTKDSGLSVVVRTSSRARRQQQT